LVSQGISKSFAKAAMDQNYNCDSGQSNVPWADRVLCDPEGPPNSDTPIVVSEEEIMAAYQCRFDNDDMQLTPDGITIYGDLTY